MMRTVVCCLFLSAAGFAADDKPDFKLTAESYGKEFATDKVAAQAKYEKKRIELTGTVYRVDLDTPGDAIVMIRGFRKKADEVSGTDVGFYPDEKEKTKYQNLRALAPGQKITVRGIQDSRGVPVLDKGEFVEVGPSPALPSTIIALKAVFANPKTKTKYEEKIVIVRAVVKDIELTNSRATFTVTDASGKGPEITASADCLSNKDLKKEFAAVKKGDLLIIMGTAQGSSDSFRLWNSVFLKEPPTGVKLPLK